MTKISIVMGYYNRLSQLKTTLYTLQSSKVCQDIEVIIVDDASSNEHIITNEFIQNYSFPIQVHRILPEHKKWRNPVIAYNIGLSHATGDWIIIQNPEVCHIGDFCQFIMNHQNHTDKYFVLPVFSLRDSQINEKLWNLLQDEKDPYHTIVPLLHTQLPPSQNLTWYCHKTIRPKAYHFCTAIHRSKLDIIKGFNPTMKDGVDYDDDEFLLRVSRVCKIEFLLDPVEKCLGIHQWHPCFSYQGNQGHIHHLRMVNQNLYNQTIKNINLISVDTQKHLPPQEHILSICHNPPRSNEA